MVLSAAAVQAADVPGSAPAPAPAPEAHELTSADLSAFLDGYLPIEMDRGAINGVTVSVVKDGRLLFARGYGSADRERHVPVSADDTLFRIGSISKLFLWTAVMQLVERRQLDLDADVQRYVDFPLPRAFGQPVTMRQLMTHTAGFEDTIRGMWVAEGDPLDLRDYLVHHVPARIFAPGSVVAYSNYGAALAGYVVQRLAGEPFDAVVQHRILQPLGMAHTTFAQPLPPALAPLMSRGYLEGADAAKPFELIRVAPAGSVSASATDMARFMIAQLGDGSVDGQRILQPATLAQMQTPQWWPHPRGPAFALGLWEDGAFAQRVIGHGGDSEWFHSGLFLLPAQHVGVFISQNSLGRHVLRDQMFRRFMERYFPAPATRFPAGAPPAAETEGLAGSYMTSRRNEHSPLFLVALMGQAVVRVDGEGLLSVSGSTGLDDRPLKYRSLGHGVWQSPDDATRRLFFNRDAAGRWQMGSHVPVEVAQRQPWTRDVRLMRLLLAGALLTALATLVGWPLAAMARWHFAAPTVREARDVRDVRDVRDARERRARIALRVAALLVLLPWAVLALPLARADNAALFLMASPAVPALLEAVRVAAGAGVFALLLAAWALAARLRRRGSWWWARVHAALVLLAAAAGLLMAWQGQLMAGSAAL